MMGFEELKQRQSVMWGSGPYERITSDLQPLYEHIVRKLEPRAGERWLDVACGTGAIAIRAARAGAEATGVDLAPDLIETAKRQAEEAGADVEFEVGDAESLSYEDASFDAVSSSIGHMFAPDHAATARELARVCRPGGRLGLATWHPERGVAEFFAIMRPFQPSPPAGVGNQFDWGRPEYVEELLGDWFELEFDEGDSPQTGESGEAIWELFSTAYGPTKTLVGSLEPERREELHRNWVEFYEGHRVDGGISHSRPYLITLGTRR